MSLVVTAADGAKFPAVPFNATIWPASSQPTTANAEIVRVTNISTDTFTITRTQESTSARTVVVGDQIAATITAKTLTDVEHNEYANTYLTVADETIPASTQVIYEDYLELAASFVYELASTAVLVIGDYATPLPAPDQNPNIFITVADETIPKNGEVVFGDYYELAAPFVSEISVGALLQLGTAPDIGSSSQFLPGYEWGFDGAPVLLEFSGLLISDTASGGDSFIVSLYEQGTQLTRIVYRLTPTTTQERLTINGKYRFTPTQGYHSYVIGAIASSTTGTPLVAAGAGGVTSNPPAFVRFTKV
jgi:hypothetical protein